MNDEASTTTTPESDVAMKFSARGNTRWIVLRGERGQQIDRFLVRHTGYSVITWQYAKAGGNAYLPTLLLTTVGRRSGQLRTKALPYYPDGDRFVVLGSNGGGPKDPDWVWNIRENGAAWIRVARRDLAVRATVAVGDERARLFAQINAQRDSLGRYQERAATYGRDVPIVVLEPRR